MKKKYNKIKVIAGYLKKSNIYFMNTIEVRPTLLRIRETVFNWISNKIYNANCLDCFAGSGALSIESISRHAQFVTLLDHNKKNINCIKKNIKRLNINNIKLINMDTLIWLKKQSNQYDIIFLDPPYYHNILQKTISIIKKNNLITHNGYIYIEQNKHHNNIIYPKTWHIYKKKNTNKINYILYIYKKVTEK